MIIKFPKLNNKNTDNTEPTDFDTVLKQGYMAVVKTIIGVFLIVGIIAIIKIV